MNMLLRYVFIFAFVAIALFALSEMSSDAEAASVTWKQSTAYLASSNANWENGTAPTTGDDVFFTALSTVHCTWDITAKVNKISIGSGYTGADAIITQSSDMSFLYYTQAAGVITFINTKVVNCDVSFVKTGGTITASVLQLLFNGVTGTYTNNALVEMRHLTVSSVTTLTASAIFTQQLDVIGTLVLTANSNYANADATTPYLHNHGLINGVGKSIFIQTATATNNYNLMVGNGTATLVFNRPSGGSVSSTFNLLANQYGGINLKLQSDHASATVTLNMATFYMSCSSFTLVNSKSLIIGSSLSSLSCSSNYDVYNGTASGWTGSLTMTGASSPWIKTPVANTINGLTWTGTNLRFASSLNITKTFWVGGSYTLGTKTVTVGTATNVTITVGNTWTLTATRYWGALNVTGTLTAATPISVWANSTCSVNGTVASTITLHVKQMTTFNGAVGNLYIEASYRTHFYGNGTWTAIYWNLTTTWNFHPEGLMPYTSPVYSKAQMRVIDPTNNAYYIEVTRFDPNVGFSIMVHGWAAETWEFTVTSTSATATLFTYNIVTPDVETDPVLIYLNGVYLDAKNMTLGSFSMNDVFNSTMGTRDYLIVCSDFGPTTPTTTFDYGIMGMCLVILSILTFASFRFQPLFIINGFVWITVAMLIIEPVQATIALLCLGVGLIFAMWGAYRALLG